MKKTADNPIDLCQECRINKFKYKCPGCSRRTCSLTCVNSHKKNSGCSGKRDVTAFVPLSQFDDATLLSDYNLLEEMKRVAESARRTNMQSHEYRLRYLRDAATRRRTKLLFFPAGMSRQKNNQTCYINKFKLIKWTIEWRFHSTSVNLLEHQVRESWTLRSIIEKHLQPSPWRNKLRRFTEEPIDNLKFYICKDQKDRRSPYRELDIDTPLRKLFSGLVILEYPVIHVFLPSDPCNFEVIKVVKPIPTQLKSEEPVKDETDDTSIHASITSKEEEIIEDEEAPEPLIVDFLEADMSMASSPWGHATEGDEPLSSTVAELMEASIDDFDFDQEMMAYSLLNPDEFLDYKPEGEAAVSSLAGLDELEEGEIPGCD